MPEGSTYFEALEYLREKNVLKGYIDGTFKPETRINRAEFVKFVVSPFLLDTNNMSACIKTNAPGTSENIFFPDTPRDSWYAAELCVAKTKQLINGYPDGTYRPEGNINFVEAAKILSNVFSLQVAGNETGEFWYRPYVKRMDDLNVIPASIKRFDQILTRGEMAEMVFRLKADRSDKATVNFSAIN